MNRRMTSARFRPERLRAVFFDLDDTLLDTSGLLVVPALTEAAERMIDAGLPAGREALVDWLRTRVAEGRGGDYFADAVRHFGVAEEQRERVARVGRRAYFAREVPSLQPLPGSRELLRRLRRRYGLYLVTAGDPATQRRKIDRLGLTPDFDAIRLVDSMQGEDKLEVFRQILDDRELEPAACLSVGDRVTGEIRDANRLGMWTVRLRRGEFHAMEPEGPEDEPDFTIVELSELAGLLGLESAP